MVLRVVVCCRRRLRRVLGLVGLVGAGVGCLVCLRGLVRRRLNLRGLTLRRIRV
jgi:hypothetical protein